jgi:hypothetical protein
MSDFVICVPTYNRAELFKTHAYKSIAANGLTDRLYIFVADEKQKAIYEEALQGLPYKEIRVRCNGEPELWKSYQAISESFPEGQKIIWIEDKVQLYCFSNGTEGAVVKDDINLKEHVENAFNICDKEGVGSFTFNGQSNYRPNTLFLKGKPWCQIGFHQTYGSISGFINHHALFVMKEEYSIINDAVLSYRYLQKYKGSLKYFYLFYTAKWTKTPGGISSTVNNEDRIRMSFTQHEKFFDDTPGSRDYINGVAVNTYKMARVMWKSKPQLKKVDPSLKFKNIEK